MIISLHEEESKKASSKGSEGIESKFLSNNFQIRKRKDSKKARYSKYCGSNTPKIINTESSVKSKNSSFNHESEILLVKKKAFPETQTSLKEMDPAVPNE